MFDSRRGAFYCERNHFRFISVISFRYLFYNKMQLEKREKKDLGEKKNERYCKKN